MDKENDENSLKQSKKKSNNMDYTSPIKQYF